MSLFIDNLADVQAAIPEPVEVPAGEWLPDQSNVNNPGALEALNVLPFGASYIPVQQLSPRPNGALPDAVQGAISTLLTGGITQVHAGTVNGIFTRLGGAAFVQQLITSVSRDYAWQFIPFKSLMVALHQDLFPLEMTIGSTAPPVNVSGSPPRAACGAMCGDFLVLGNLLDDPDDSHHAAPNRIRWSGIKNIEANWVTDVVTQADYNDMPPEGGAVIAISGRENMVVFQERKISFGRYVNLPDVWDIETVEEDIGCIARDSVVSVGPYKFFISGGGFRVWNGTNTQSIGHGKVDKYFFSRLNYAHRARIVGAADMQNNCVAWAFPTSNDGSLNEIIFYNFLDDKWSHSDLVVENLLSSAITTSTIEDFTGTVDDYGTSYVDDPSYVAGGKRLLAGFDLLHNYGLFTGDNMEATVDTAEFSGPNYNRVFVNSARPLVDAVFPMVNVQPIGRDQFEGDALLFGTAVEQEADGNCPILADARYLRFRTNIPAGVGWNRFRGIQIERKAGGKF